MGKGESTNKNLENEEHSSTVNKFLLDLDALLKDWNAKFGLDDASPRTAAMATGKASIDTSKKCDTGGKGEVTEDDTEQLTQPPVLEFVEGSFTDHAFLSTAAPQMTSKLAKRLKVEFKTIQTSVDASRVFVRVSEEALHLMKFMIRPAEDTPYAGGLFEFDLYIPSQYPNVPPKVLLRTTGAGKVRFNPNLYNCGKVCLSLLGTWQGGAAETRTGRRALQFGRSWYQSKVRFWGRNIHISMSQVLSSSGALLKVARRLETQATADTNISESPRFATLWWGS